MTPAEPTPVQPSPGSAGASAGPAGGSGAARTTSSAAVNTTALTKDEAAALQTALQAENAAIWAYALVAANAPDDGDTVAAMRSAHLMARDDTASRLIAGGQQPTAPASAYSTPKVSDAASARALGARIESDCAAAWHSVVGRTDRTDLRSFAAAALSQAAVRTVQWKQLAKATPLTTPFPGEAP